MNNFKEKHRWWDLKIKCSDGEKLYYSRYILMTYSPVFKAMFQSSFEEGTSDSISLSFTQQTLDTILAYIHDCINIFSKGTVDNGYLIFTKESVEALVDMLSFFDMYQMDGIKSMMDVSLTQHLKKQNQIPIDLINLIFKYICSQIEEIYNGNEKEFPKLDMEIITSLTPDYFYAYIDYWLIDENLKHLDDILTHIVHTKNKGYFKKKLLPLLKHSKNEQLIKEVLWKYAESI